MFVTMPAPATPGAYPIPDRPILVVDDDAKIVRLVKTYLEREGFSVVTAADGPGALDAIETHEPALVVLDLMLPELDGRAVIRAVRRDEEAGTTPILILSARGTTVDRIAGLEDGADDYLPKPFSLAELQARLRALGRRGRGEDGDVLESGAVRLDSRAREVEVNGEAVELTGTELALLEELMRNQGVVLSRDQLRERVWGDGDEPTSNVVDIYVHYVRRKLRAAGLQQDPIRTVRGLGYAYRRPD
jgi:DNA-binding response OmpR family regulator